MSYLNSIEKVTKMVLKNLFCSPLEFNFFGVFGVSQKSAVGWTSVLLYPRSNATLWDLQLRKLYFLRNLAFSHWFVREQKKNLICTLFSKIDACLTNSNKLYSNESGFNYFQIWILHFSNKKWCFKRRKKYLCCSEFESRFIFLGVFCAGQDSSLSRFDEANDALDSYSLK